MDPTEAMKIFKQTISTKPMIMADASTDYDLPTTTMLLNADKDVLHDKVGRNATTNVNANANATPNATLNAVTTNAVKHTIL